jgi:hypothetical protein
MKQKIIPILVLSLVTIIIVVMLFFPPPWNKEIEGCTDATCSNYNPNATIDDGSCEDKELPHAIKEIIDKLAERSWDRQHYLQSKTNIGQYYHANSKSGTTEEENALHELKLVYMTVLNKETERIVDNCFEDDDKIKSEVIDFYNKYETESNDIIQAKSWFTTEDDIYAYKKEVNTFLSKRCDNHSYKKMKNKINTLKNSNNYRSKIQNCGELSSIIDNLLKKLSSFNKAEERYKYFEKLFLNKEGLEDKNFIPGKWRDKRKNIYMDYTWYKKDIKEIDNLLRQKKEIEAEREVELYNVNPDNIRGVKKREQERSDINKKYDDLERKRVAKLNKKKNR